MLKELLLYSNCTKEEYSEIRPEISRSNLSAMRYYTLIIPGTMLILLTASYLIPSLEKNRMLYHFFLLTSIVLYLLIWHTKATQPRRIFIFQIVFIELLYFFGICLGTLIEPNQLAISYAIFLFALPLLFTECPCYVIGTTVVSLISFFAMAIPTQNREILEYNTTNIIPYSIISIFLGSYMMIVKTKGLRLQYTLEKTAERSALTGLYSRHCFTIDCAAIEDTWEMAVLSIDVNALKMVNDQYGHQAGDELLKKAAYHIQNTFGPYGKCYHISGDEFVVILSCNRDKVQKYVNALKTNCQFDTGKQFRVDLAVGYAIGYEYPGLTVEQLYKIADEEMYKDKAIYYRKLGGERRKRYMG